MASLDKSTVEHQLKRFIDPHLDTDLLAAKSVKNIAIEDTKVSLQIQLGYPAKSYIPSLKQQLQNLLLELEGVEQVEIDVSVNISAHAVQKTLKPLSKVKNIIAIASGKGGVGKSTTTVNLALALAAEGAKVGILDADIYGPSIPTMLGLQGKPETADGKFFLPKVSFGIQTISIGYLVDPDQAVIWRGPMATGALQQLLTQTLWEDLDYLMIDLPPGTGDIQLTLAQQIPVSGAVIVTTPQDIALIDAQRGLAMFEKVNVPILGLVENMSLHICSHCGHEEAIFGQGGGADMAERNHVTLLGALPLDKSIREFADQGRPSLVADSEGRPAHIYREIARKMAGQLALRHRDFSSRFPNIVIQNS